MTQTVFRASCGCKEEYESSETAFRKLHFSLRDMTERYTAETRAMAIALTTVDSFSQLKAVMRQFLPGLECRSFDLYLFDKVLEEGDLDIYRAEETQISSLILQGNENCTLLLRYRNGVFLEDIHEDIHDFVRDAASSEHGGTYIVSPIHFTDQFFGYCVISESAFALESALYYSWIMNIGNAIENIRRQRLMKMMIFKLEQSWCYDSLTEVYNRKGFQKYGGRVWRESVAKHKNVLLLFIDLDGLKKINDNYGHDTGDHCIKSLATILKEARRHGEAVMRYGGDEFVIIASDVEESYVNEYVARLQSAITQFNEKNTLPYTLSASIGTNVLLPGKDDKMDDAIDIADQQMYKIKKEKYSR